jgi:hypothetical protein
MVPRPANARFGVAKKTRHKGEIFRLAIKTVARMPRRVAFCTDVWQAGPRRQKLFAIGQRNGEDQPTVAGRPSSHAYLRPEVKG